MPLRKNSLTGIEKGMSTPKGKTKGLSRSGLSRIQEHIDIVKGKSHRNQEDSLRRIERESHPVHPSALKLTRGFDHSSVLSPSVRSNAYSIHPLPSHPINDAFANAEPFSTEIEAFDTPFSGKDYGYGQGRSSIAFNEDQTRLQETLPEHERPYQRPLPEAPSPSPSKGAVPSQQPAPALYPREDASIQPVKQNPPVQPLPETAAAMSAFERDIDQMISTAKNRGDSPAVRTATKDKTMPQSGLSREASGHPHGIFEKMGKNLQFANSFNIGSVDVVKKFDQFDRELNLPAVSSQPSGKKDLFLQLSAQDLADTDIVADLAEIDMARSDTALAAGFKTGAGQDDPTPPPESARTDTTVPNAGEKLPSANEAF